MLVLHVQILVVPFALQAQCREQLAVSRASAVRAAFKPRLAFSNAFASFDCCSNC